MWGARLAKGNWRQEKKVGKETSELWLLQGMLAWKMAALVCAEGGVLAL